MGYDSKGILVFNLKYEHAITGTCGQDPMKPAPFFFLFFLDVPPFHPQLIQQSTAVPNFPSSGNAIIDNSIVSLYNVPGDGSCFFHALSLGLVGNFSKTIQY